MEKKEIGRDAGRPGRLPLEEELAAASLTIQEEPEQQEDLDDGYYLDDDFDDSMLENDLDILDDDFDLDDDVPYQQLAAGSSGSAAGRENADGQKEAASPAAAEQARQQEAARAGQRAERSTAGPAPDRKGDISMPPEPGGAASRSRRGKPGGKGLRIAGIAAAVVLLSGAALYIVKAQSYRDTFYPNTVINGLDAAGMTVEQVKAQIASALNGYEIRLIQRYDEQSVITGEEIGLQTVFDGSLEELMKEQNPYLWGRSYFKGQDSQIDAMVAYDEGKFQACLNRLAIFDPASVRPYAAAYLSDYIPGQGYEIVPEEPGTAVNREVFADALSKAVLALQPELSLEEAECYVNRLGTEPDAALVELRDQMNRYAGLKVTYTFGNQQEILNGDEIHQWISFDENYQVSVDAAMVSDYVSKLAKKYNTAYSKRKFKTSYGPEVEVSGFYGWQINQKAESEALAGIIASGESQTREPEYTQRGASHEGNDYGNTYAEVNLTAQHMFLYKNGEKILESDFVSGNVSRGYTTPPGIFSITYKQRDAVLKGQGYASPVKFWMPFNRGIGFHDASWRNTFGGSIYKTNGSHGCVNMPYSAAKTLFENVYAGMPVICYNLDGTGSSKSTAASGSGKTASPPAQTQAAVQPAQTAAAAQPAETAAVQTQPETVAAQPGEPAAAGGASLTEQSAAGPGGGTSNPAAGPGAQPSSGQGTEYGPGGQTPETAAPTEGAAQPPAAAPAPLPAETPAAPDYSAGPGAEAAPGSTAGPGGP